MTRLSADHGCIEQPAAKQVQEGVHVTPEGGGGGSGGGAKKRKGGRRLRGGLPVRCL